jgi:hypothetical protein
LRGFVCFIGTVCNRILKESPATPLWTIHDSILTRASRGDFVRKVMEEEVAKFGVHPRLRVEEYHRSKPLIALTEIGTGLLDGNPGKPATVPFWLNAP